MRIAIIEDNESVAKGIAYRLQDRGHATDVIHDGRDADEFLKSDDNDLIILDVNLPGLDGLSVLRALRGRGDERPVLLLTARSTTADRVDGLDAGADDYLVKPFMMEELEARIRALSRRAVRKLQAVISIGGLEFDPDSRTARLNGQEMELPRRELALLDALVMSRGVAKSKSDLIEMLYGTGADVGEGVIEAHISRLRKKLAPGGIEIRMRRNIGYVLQERGG